MGLSIAVWVELKRILNKKIDDSIKCDIVIYMHATNTFNSHKQLQIITISQLISKCQDRVFEYFEEYGINSNSLLSDIKKIILHCTLTQFIDEMKPRHVLIIINDGNNCNEKLNQTIGEDKCQKTIQYMINNLKKIFKHRYLELNAAPDIDHIPGEILDAVNRTKKFNFESLQNFLSKNSLSGLKCRLKEDLSTKQKISNNFS